MSLAREPAGPPQLYRGHLIQVRIIKPDFLCYVGDIELSGFFISESAAVSAGQRHINAEIEAKEKKAQGSK
jgi:hypothetical protein